MPQAIPGILLNIAIGAAVNAAVGFVSSKIGGGDPQSGQGVEFAPRAGLNEPVRVIFGEYPTGGRFIHQNSYGDDNEYLQLVYECGRTEYHGLTGLLKDGKAVALSGSNSDPKGRVIEELKKGSTPHGWVKYYTGAVGQAADAELVAHANPSERWPSTKTLTGTAYAIVTLRYDEEVFEGGLPTWTFIWRGAKLYDRRKDSTQPGGSGLHRWGDTSTYEWTRNPAIILDNFRRGLWTNGVRVLGIGVSEAACHHARIVAAANLCDESVTYDDTGRTLPRYLFGGEIGDDQDQISVMRMLETAMAGYGAEFGGAYAPLPAQTMIPVLTLTDRDRVSDEDVLERTRMDPTEVKTAYGGVFVSPEDGWVDKEYGLRFDADVEEAEGGRRQGPLDLQFVPARETAGTIAEIFRRRDRFTETEVAVYGLKAAKLEPGDVVTRQSALFGAVQMMVWGIEEMKGARYRLTLRRWDNAIVPDPGEGFLPIVPDVVPAPVPSRPITVSAFLASAVSQVSGDQSVPAIKVTWTPITDRTVDRVVVKYWVDGTPDEARYLSIEDPRAGTAIIEGVAPETDYVLSGTIVTTPPRATIWSADRDVTTGPLTVAAVPADASVDWEKFSADAKRQINWLTGGLRAALDQLDRIGSLISEQDLDQFNQREQLRRDLVVRLGTIEAGFTEVIEVALGEGGAIATKLEGLYAAFGGNTAQALVKFEALAAEGGLAARWAVQLSTDGETYNSTGLYLEVTSGGVARIVLDANQTLITTDGGATVAAMFNSEGAFIRDLTTGTIRSEDGASYWALSTGGGLRVVVAP